MKVFSRNKKILLFVIMATVLTIGILLFPKLESDHELSFTFDVYAEAADSYQLFYKQDGEFTEEYSEKNEYNQIREIVTMKFSIPQDAQFVRLDLGNQEGKIIISKMKLRYLWAQVDVDNSMLLNDQNINGIESIQELEEQIEIISNSIDPYIIVDLNKVNLNKLYQLDKYMPYLIKLLICLVVNILLLLFFKTYKSIKGLGIELLNNKQLIWDLSKNDFKTKYAGSYLGIIWAFVQPVITVLIYWFVFQVGFRSGSVENVPFVLWLVTGMVPWFFYSDGIMNSTNSMLEYSYLVKKVVFKISILPIVKIFSALFVHAFFVGFAMVLFIIYGYVPSIHIVQVVYYTLCAFLLVLGISYATSAIIIFFRDLSQIIGILLQVGMWMTPIMWSYTMIPVKYQWILKINPMYYIVEGYRDSFINHVWLWERYNQTIYFWVVTGSLFVIGTVIFKKLKPHFADVL